MWTYLLIFLSVLCLTVVFLRRLYFVLIKKAEEEKVVPEKVDEPKEEPESKKKISKDGKAEMERLFQRAVALIKRKEPKEAVKTLVQALAIDHDYLDAQKELGKLYLDQKMWGKASAVYKYLAEKSEDAVDYSHLGLALYNAEEFEEAAEAYQKAVLLDPKRPQRYVSLGQTYKDLEKWPLALIAFNKALALDKDNVDYLLLAADAFVELEDFDGARGVLERVLELAPKSKMAPKMLKEIEEKEKEVVKD